MPSWRFGGRGCRGTSAGAYVIIFDCNGVLVDSERIAAAVAAESFNRIGIPLTAELVIRYFFGRRPADMFATVEAAMQRSLPPDFAAGVAAATHRTAALRTARHAARRPRADLAARTEMRRVVGAEGPRARSSLQTAGLARFFEGNLFSASDVAARQARARPVPACRRPHERAADGLHRGRGFAGRRHRRDGGRHDARRVRRRQPRGSQTSPSAWWRPAPARSSPTCGTSRARSSPARLLSRARRIATESRRGYCVLGGRLALFGAGFAGLSPTSSKPT